MQEMCAAQLRSLREQIRALFASRVDGLPALPAALAAINDALTRAPTAALLHWDDKDGPYRAVPCPTTEIVDHALATLAANAADLLTGPDAERLTACGSTPATATCCATAAATGAPPAAATAPAPPAPTPGAPGRRRTEQPAEIVSQKAVIGQINAGFDGLRQATKARLCTCATAWTAWWRPFPRCRQWPNDAEYRNFRTRRDVLRVHLTVSRDRCHADPSRSSAQCTGRAPVARPGASIRRRHPPDPVLANPPQPHARTRVEQDS